MMSKYCLSTITIVQRQVGPLGHMILIPSKPITAFTPYFYAFKKEERNVHFHSLSVDLTDIEPRFTKP